MPHIDTQFRKIKSNESTGALDNLANDNDIDKLIEKLPPAVETKIKIFFEPKSAEEILRWKRALVETEEKYKDGDIDKDIIFALFLSIFKNPDMFVQISPGLTQVVADKIINNILSSKYDYFFNPETPNIRNMRLKNICIRLSSLKQEAMLAIRKKSYIAGSDVFIEHLVAAAVKSLEVDEYIKQSINENIRLANESIPNYIPMIGTSIYTDSSGTPITNNNFRVLNPKPDFQSWDVLAFNKDENSILISRSDSDGLYAKLFFKEDNTPDNHLVTLFDTDFNKYKKSIEDPETGWAFIEAKLSNKVSGARSIEDIVKILEKDLPDDPRILKSIFNYYSINTYFTKSTFIDEIRKVYYDFKKNGFKLNPNFDNRSWFSLGVPEFKIDVKIMELVLIEKIKMADSFEGLVAVLDNFLPNSEMMQEESDLAILSELEEDKLLKDYLTVDKLSRIFGIIRSSEDLSDLNMVPEKFGLRDKVRELIYQDKAKKSEEKLKRLVFEIKHK